MQSPQPQPHADPNSGQPSEESSSSPDVLHKTASSTGSFNPSEPYRCPSCRTLNNLHQEDCRWRGTSHTDIEKAYVDIIAQLSATPRSKQKIKAECHGGWNELNEAVFDHLETSQRIMRLSDYEWPLEHSFDLAIKKRAQGVSGFDPYLLLTPDQWYSIRVPSIGDIETIWDYGPVDGVKDTAVCSILSWHEMEGFTWEQTRQRTIDWLRETGGWERGSWEESSPEEVVDSKRHIFDEGYGWSNFATAAASAIEGRTDS